MKKGVVGRILIARMKGWRKLTLKKQVRDRTLGKRNDQLNDEK